MAVNRFLLIIFAFSFLSGTLCESPAIKKFNWKLKNSVNFNNNDFSFPTANLESVDNEKHDSHVGKMTVCETKEKCQKAFVALIKAVHNENRLIQNGHNFNILLRKPHHWG